MDAMPRPRPPHLHRQITRHGKTVWYVRIGKGQRVRLRAEFGSDEFETDTKRRFWASRGRPRKLLPGPWRGSWRATARLPSGSKAFRSPRAGSEIASSHRCSRRPGMSGLLKSRRRLSRAVASVGRARRHRLAISSIPCAACSNGLPKRSSSGPIRRSGSSGYRAKRAMASFHGPKSTSAYEARWPIGHGSGCGSTFCSTPDYAAEMRCALAVSMSETA